VGFARFGEVDGDKTWLAMFRKVTAATSVANQWYDDSMLAGTPPANFYASSPLEAATLDANDGIRHWRHDGSSSEHLLEAVVFGGSGTLEAPSSFVLCDYVLYYPFLDGDSTDPQDLDNTVALPRFADGKGLRMFLVALGTGAATGGYSISYTNSDGTPGRTATGNVVLPTAAGFILTGGNATGVRAPFVPLESGDVGVRSVEQFTWTSPPGGIAALVVVKPIAQFGYTEIGTAAETVFHPRMPEIHPDAFLGLLRFAGLATPNARTFTGMLTTIRS
jgi:hypothetical protein